MTTQEIKDNYAKEQGFDDWADLYIRSLYHDEEIFFTHEDRVFELVQQEQQKLIAENVFNARNYTVIEGIQLITDSKIQSSIINENNIIR